MSLIGSVSEREDSLFCCTCLDVNICIFKKEVRAETIKRDVFLNNLVGCENLRLRNKQMRCN